MQKYAENYVFDFLASPKLIHCTKKCIFWSYGPTWPQKFFKRLGHILTLFGDKRLIKQGWGATKFRKTKTEETIMYFAYKLSSLWVPLHGDRKQDIVLDRNCVSTFGQKSPVLLYTC